jgi:hypothetical protein
MSPADRRGAAFGYSTRSSRPAQPSGHSSAPLVGAFGWQSLFVLAVPVAIRGHRRRRGRPARDRPARRPAGRPTPASTSGPFSSRRCSSPLRRIRASAVAAMAAASASVWWRRSRLPLLVVFVGSTRGGAAGGRSALFASRSFTAGCRPGVLGATVILHATFILVPLLVERLSRRVGRDRGLVLPGSPASAPSRRRSVAACPTGAAGGFPSWRVRLPDHRPVRPVACRRRDDTALVGVLLCVVGFGMGSPGRRARRPRSSPCRATGRMAAGTYYTGRISVASSEPCGCGPGRRSPRPG